MPFIGLVARLRIAALGPDLIGAGHLFRDPTERSASSAQPHNQEVGWSRSVSMHTNAST